MVSPVTTLFAITLLSRSGCYAAAVDVCLDPSYSCASEDVTSLLQTQKNVKQARERPRRDKELPSFGSTSGGVCDKTCIFSSEHGNFQFHQCSDPICKGCAYCCENKRQKSARDWWKKDGHTPQEIDKKWNLECEQTALPTVVHGADFGSTSGGLCDQEQCIFGSSLTMCAYPKCMGCSDCCADRDDEDCVRGRYSCNAALCSQKAESQGQVKTCTDGNGYECGGCMFCGKAKQSNVVQAQNHVQQACDLELCEDIAKSDGKDTACNLASMCGGCKFCEQTAEASLSPSTDEEVEAHRMGQTVDTGRREMIMAKRRQREMSGASLSP